MQVTMLIYRSLVISKFSYFHNVNGSIILPLYVVYIFVYSLMLFSLWQFCNEYAVPKDKLENFKDVTPQDIVCSQVRSLFKPSHACVCVLCKCVKQSL